MHEIWIDFGNAVKPELIPTYHELQAMAQLKMKEKEDYGILY